MIEFLKSILFGIVEGITEWLPVSSTGHLILLNEFVELSPDKDFKSMYDVVIQLGAILAVIVLFFHKLNPFALSKTKTEKNQTWSLWFKVCVAIIPSGVLGVLLDEELEKLFYETEVGGISLSVFIISAALIIYGIAFLLVERRGEFRSRKITSKDGPTAVMTRRRTINDVHDIDYRTAILIGCFQVLSLIPGTSRSGSTILGAILIGVSRSAGAEFSFFMAIPTMLGASAIKLLGYFMKTGFGMDGQQFGVLLVGMAVSFAVSLLVIKGLMEFVRNHSFASFGWYRIVLGTVVLLYFLVF